MSKRLRRPARRQMFDLLTHFARGVFSPAKAGGCVEPPTLTDRPAISENYATHKNIKYLNLAYTLDYAHQITHTTRMSNRIGLVAYTTQHEVIKMSKKNLEETTAGPADPFTVSLWTRGDKKQHDVVVDIDKLTDETKRYLLEYGITVKIQREAGGSEGKSREDSVRDANKCADRIQNNEVKATRSGIDKATALRNAQLLVMKCGNKKPAGGNAGFDALWREMTAASDPLCAVIEQMVAIGLAEKVEID